jgi:hypothetical protein
MPLYDCLFTTKSYHLDNPSITRRVKKIVLVPHGFDPEVHRRLPVTPALERFYRVRRIVCGSVVDKERASAAGSDQRKPTSEA